MNKYAPVIGITWKGKFFVLLIRCLLSWLFIFKRNTWKYPVRNFEENPRYFKLKDSIYLAYKYYMRTLLDAEKNSGIEAYFHKQKFTAAGTESNLTISLGGDLMPYKYINRELCRHLWDESGCFFFSSDIVFANLETPVDTLRKPSTVPEVMIKGMHFNASEEIFDVFNGLGLYKGFDVLSVANNHSLDQGEAGLDRTLEFLKEKKIHYAGAALRQDDVHDFPIINRNGINVAFIAFTFSLDKFELPPEHRCKCNHLRLNQPGIDLGFIVEQARIARHRGANIVIASLHMGNAYQAYPGKNTIDTIHRICSEAGIDVVVAGHPHNPQPVEWFEYVDTNGEKKQSLIFYSLGDFVAYDIYTLAHLPLLVKLHIRKSDKEVIVSGFEILPLYLSPVMDRNKVTSLIFTHAETAFLLNEMDSVYKNKELSSIRHFYERLFTASQREAIIVTPDKLRSYNKHR